MGGAGGAATTSENATITIGSGGTLNLTTGNGGNGGNGGSSSVDYAPGGHAGASGTMDGTLPYKAEES